MMGRAVLKRLKESTLLTFFQLCKDWGLKLEQDYTYNSMEGVIRFPNGSEIYLRDLFAYPSDPEFESFGSTEFTTAFIDEASQVSAKAKAIVTTRLRFRHKEFQTIPKLLICSNPTKNFLYYDFYKPDKESKLLQYRKFVKALASDNPYLSESYIEQLRRLPGPERERLLHGNWEYDDDPAKMMEFDKITDLFTNKPARTGHKYITCDVARFGGDKITIGVWDDFYMYHMEVYEKESTKETRLHLEALEEKEHVPRSNIIVDEDGVGGGVKDEMPGIMGFVNNSTALHGGNYSNLKSQAYFYLADYVNKGQIGIYPDIRQEWKDRIIEDLEQVRKKDIDKDGKQAVVPKEEVKERLGRSPDYSDCIAMRMWFAIRGSGEWGSSAVAML